MTLWQDNQPQTRREARERERAAALEKSRSAGRGESAAPPPAERVDQAVADDRENESVPVPAGARVGDQGAGAGGPVVTGGFADGGFGAPRGAARPQLPNYETSFDALLAPDAGTGEPSSDRDEELDGVDDPASGTESPSAEEDHAETLRSLFGPRSAERSEGSPSALYRDAAATGEVEPVTAPVSLVPESVRPPVSATARPAEAPGAVPVVPQEPVPQEPVPQVPVSESSAASAQDAGASAQDAAARPFPVTPDSAAASAEPTSETPGLAAGEKTMTRRELRAMLQAEQSRRGVASPGPSVPDPGASSAAEGSDAGRSERVAPVARAAGPDPAPPTVAFTVTPPSSGVGPDVAPPPGPKVPERSAPSATDLDAGRTPFEPPVGHWSRAGETDRRNEEFDQILSRGVLPSGGATTTSALILPSIPTAPPTTGPITATGEILVTGSIDLPRGLGSTGQHPDRYDTSEMDRMFERAEGEMNTADVEPIRASHAVSGHASTRGVITPPKKSHGRLPLILSITAGVLLVAVVGLLVTGYVLKVF